jgi:hypothetical protein
MGIEGGNDKPGMVHQLNQIATLDGIESMALTADYTIGAAARIKTYFVTTAASNRTITLPPAADCLNKVIEIMKVDSGSGTVIIDGNGSETINGRATITDIASQYHGVKIKCNGTSWIIFDWIKPYEKQYLGGTTYNGVSLSVTGTNFTLSRGVFVPKQTINGIWRLIFNIKGEISIAATSLTLTVAGLTFTKYQAISTLEGSLGTVLTRGFVIEATGQMAMYCGGSVVSFFFSGDVELSSKPTWAD